MTVDLAQVEAAADRIAPLVARTPVLGSAALDAWIGAEVHVKAEHHHPTGAFKLRGATNAVMLLDDDAAARGVACHSSGNHAYALAFAAARRGIPAYVVMPETTTDAKRANVERAGAEITWCANALDARERALAELIERTGATEIHPFNNEHVIAGAGTAALELLAEVPGLEVIIAPIGGGGLCSGTAVAAAGVQVVGGIVVDHTATIADGLRTGCSAQTTAILDAHHVERVVVSEEEIVAAVAAVAECLGEVIEPSAAVAFAAAVHAPVEGRRVGIICSGGNT